MLLLLTALFLGAVEGLTEFLPVSSTGHLILLVDLLGLPTPPGRVFEVVIQFGAISAVIWLYRGRLWQAVTGARQDAAERAFLRNIIIATLPALAVGGMFHSIIKDVLFDPLVVAGVLVVGGLVILLVERLNIRPAVMRVEDITPWRALAVGCCQALAVVPGTSRSGATIIGALLLGVERRTAAEFSFFLAIPTMLAAASFDLYQNFERLNGDSLTMLAVGFASAFVVAMAVVRAALNFIGRYGFTIFGWYRIALGLLMLVVILT